MIKCFACGVSFEVTFEEADADARFCPHCGQESIDDIEIVENYDVATTRMFYDEDEDGLS